MKKFILSDVRPFEVSLVDKGAIKKDFLIYKNQNGNSKSKNGGGKMKIEEAIQLGLIDESEKERLAKKDQPDSNVMKELMSSVQKIVAKALGKEPDMSGMSEEEKKAALEKKQKEEEANKSEITKLSSKVDDLTKTLDGMKKGQELLAKLSSAQDPKEFLKILKEIKELNKKEPESLSADEKIVKALDLIEKRLEAITLKSNGLHGQEDTPAAKKSNWGGAFR